MENWAHVLMPGTPRLGWGPRKWRPAGSCPSLPPPPPLSRAQGPVGCTTGPKFAHGTSTLQRPLLGGVTDQSLESAVLARTVRNERQGTLLRNASPRNATRCSGQPTANQQRPSTASHRHHFTNKQHSADSSWWQSVLNEQNSGHSSLAASINRRGWRLTAGAQGRPGRPYLGKKKKSWFPAHSPVIHLLCGDGAHGTGGGAWHSGRGCKLYAQYHVGSTQHWLIAHTPRTHTHPVPPPPRPLPNLSR